MFSISFEKLLKMLSGTTIILTFLIFSLYFPLYFDLYKNVKNNLPTKELACKIYFVITANKSTLKIQIEKLPISFLCI